MSPKAGVQKSIVLLLVATSFSCADGQEAKRVELPIWLDGDGLTAVTTDLGYEIQLQQVTVAVDDLRFAIAGEAHASLWRSLTKLVIPEAHAHPGHYQGGEVTGELPGHFVLRFSPDKSQELGKATLLVGKYQSASFTFAHATADDAGSDASLVGQTAVLRGTATSEQGATAFEVIIDSPPGRELVGIPFEHEVKEASNDRLVLRLLAKDPLEGDSLFDGVDFLPLDTDGDGSVEIAATAEDPDIVNAHNTIRRVFQTHDHFRIAAEP